ncbi:hypothetical protein SRHO_G00270890 [Serrasalmus rhombeus]
MISYQGQKEFFASRTENTVAPDICAATSSALRIGVVRVQVHAFRTNLYQEDKGVYSQFGQILPCGTRTKEDTCGQTKALQQFLLTLPSPHPLVLLILFHQTQDTHMGYLGQLLEEE